MPVQRVWVAQEIRELLVEDVLGLGGLLRCAGSCGYCGMVVLGMERDMLKEPVAVVVDGFRKEREDEDE